MQCLRIVSLSFLQAFNFFAIYSMLPDVKKKVERIIEQTLADFSSQTKCQRVQTSRIIFLVLPYIINILLTVLSRSVWENLDLCCVYRPHCVLKQTFQSVDETLACDHSNESY